MRRAIAMLTAGLGGCGAGGVGESSGVLTLTHPETDEVHEVRFAGGALTWDDEGGHHVALTSWGFNFHCDYARVHLAALPGQDVDRRRPHHDLLWADSSPSGAVVVEHDEGLLGGGQTGATYALEAEMTFDDEGRAHGMLTTDAGDLTFDAEPCGSF